MKKAHPKTGEVDLGGAKLPPASSGRELDSELHVALDLRRDHVRAVRPFRGKTQIRVSRTFAKLPVRDTPAPWHTRRPTGSSRRVVSQVCRYRRHHSRHRWRTREEDRRTSRDLAGVRTSSRRGCTPARECMLREHRNSIQHRPMPKSRRFPLRCTRGFACHRIQPPSPEGHRTLHLGRSAVDTPLPPQARRRNEVNPDKRPQLESHRPPLRANHRGRKRLPRGRGRPSPLHMN